MQDRPLLIQAGRVLDLDGDLDNPSRVDVLVANGKIVELGENLRGRYADAEILDASDSLVIPGSSTRTIIHMTLC